MVSASVLTISVAMSPGFLPGALAVQLSEDLDITLAGVGVVVGIFFAVAALASPLMGRVAERTGWAPSMRLAALVAAVTLGLTPFLATSMTTLALVAIVAGVGVALAQPATNLGLARCTVRERQGMAYGFKHAAVPAAAAFAGFGVPLLAIPFGWEWVYFAAAIVAVFTTLLIPFDASRYEVRKEPSVEPEIRGRLRTPVPPVVLLAVGGSCGPVRAGPVAPPALAAEAGEILSEAGLSGGLVLHLGCGKGQLTAALRAGENYQVHGLDTDAGNVKAAREFLRSQGLYGPVSVDRLRGKSSICRPQVI